MQSFYFIWNEVFLTNFHKTVWQVFKPTLLIHIRCHMWFYESVLYGRFTRSSGGRGGCFKTLSQIFVPTLPFPKNLDLGRGADWSILAKQNALTVVKCNNFVCFEGSFERTSFKEKYFDERSKEPISNLPHRTCELPHISAERWKKKLRFRFGHCQPCLWTCVYYIYIYLHIYDAFSYRGDSLIRLLQSCKCVRITGRYIAFDFVCLVFGFSQLHGIRKPFIGWVVMWILSLVGCNVFVFCF